MADIIFDCPQCGHQLEVDENGAGMTVPCPECSQSIQIPPSGNSSPISMKYSCPYCRQIIDYTPEMFGQLIDCPGCKKTVEIGTSQHRSPPPAPPRQYKFQSPSIQVARPSSLPPELTNRHFTKYKVVPFVASITQKDGASKAASQLQALVSMMSQDGWDYVRLESVETVIEGDNGCFGLGATPSSTISITMAVFRK